MPIVKNSIFTFISIVLIPVLFFVFLELGLTVFNVGVAFNYFHKVDINGQPHYQENPRFAHQFYPSSLNIGPLYNTFAETRSADSLRVYVLGGSAAMGYPHKNHAVDRHLKVQLEAALPSRKIEVINTAMTSVNSHVVYEVAKSIPGKPGDYAVILMGNNEVVGPYGPGTYNQNFLSNLTLIRGLQALKRTRIWQAVSSIILQADAATEKQELKWQGMQMFTSHGVSLDDPRMSSVYRHYEINLRDIIDILNRKGMKVILSSVPVNLRHSAPFLSIHNAALSSAQLESWSELSDTGSQRLGGKDWRGAIAAYQAALNIDSDYADTHFRLATAYENVRDHQKAKEHYVHALDLDALRFRADSRLNQIIGDVAASIEYEGFGFVDSAAAFEKASQPLQPGWNLLLEHVHYDFPGNHVLAAEISRSILSSYATRDVFQPLTRREVARRTGFPNHETIDVIKGLLDMVQKPPFTGQSNYAELKDFVSRKIDRVTREVGSPSTVIKRRQELVDSGLADWKVHYELAVLNEFVRNREAAYDHYRKSIELYPHSRESYIKIAQQMSQEGKWREAIMALEQSLQYTRRDKKLIAETIGWLGGAYFRAGDYEKATDLLLDIPEKYPDQIGLTFTAYGNLIKYSQQEGKIKDSEQYVEDVQRYARSIIRDGKNEEYPLIYKRMSQIMAMVGNVSEAQKWASQQL